MSMVQGAVRSIGLEVSKKPGAIQWDGHEYW